MLALFGTVKDKLKPKIEAPCIDNWVFKLHYRVTFTLLLVGTILVSSREYFGDQIQCISDMTNEAFAKVIERFCYFSATFTVEDDASNDEPFGEYRNAYSIPGIHPFGIGSQKAIKKHTYYQWVPFVLFGQGMMFYLTRILWKKFEDNRIRKLVSGLTLARFAFLDKKLEANDGREIPTREKRDACIKRIKHMFLDHVKLNKSWARSLIFCEVLNVAHVILQFYITDEFLGNQFYTLCPKLWNQGPRTLDLVFPKLSKCTFHKYGPSGSIQVHDALCVLALNIITEKIYVFLWCWLVTLFAASCLILLWRLISLILYSRSMAFNQFVFGHTFRGKVHPWHLQILIKHCYYPDWLFLRYLAKNLDGFTFRELFTVISEDLEERKPFVMMGGQGEKTGGPPAGY